MLIGNYFKTAYRNIVKNKLYAAINIIGLAIGFVCAILIGIYIQYELSYDKYHEKYKRIYRIESDFTISGKNDKVAPTPIPFGPTFYREMPEVESYLRFMPLGERLFKNGDRQYYEKEVLLADSTVFDILTYKFISGSPVNALTEPQTMVLTQSFAKKYFGDEDPVGKQLQTGDGRSLKITGLIEDVPGNSHIKFDALISMETVAELVGKDNFNNTSPNSFWNVQVNTFILLSENTSIDQVMSRYQDVYDKYMKSVGDQLQASFNIMTTRIDKIHLFTKLQWDRPVGNKDYILIFFLVAIFTLLIASINYMNLATARSSKRAREVGIRKVSGAHPPQLRRQFLIESILLALLSYIMAVVISELFLPSFSSLTGKEFHKNILDNLPILGITFILVILVGWISGSYPAFFLSSFSPVNVLKGGRSASTGKGSGMLRKILVIFQFAISTVMIIGTFIVGSQIRFINKKDIGFNKENILITQVHDTSFVRKLPLFREEILQHPGVEGMCTASNLPGNELGMIVFRVEKDGQMSDQTVKLLQVDYDYFDLMGMEIVSGRNFSKDMGTDESNAFIVNEKAVEAFGWKELALGKKIQIGRDETQFFRDGKIIGVVKDFNFVSLHNEIEPIIILPQKISRLIHIRISEHNQAETLEFLKEKWDEFAPGYPFVYSFLENNMNERYETERRIGKLLGYFAFIAILISCLGLFGLSSFVVEQRIKEIGIRKVLGANIGRIMYLLSKDFMLLVILANILAYPVAWYLLNKWLQNFAYSTPIHWWIFPLATLITICIAIAITNIRAVGAARANPAETLKYE